MGARIFWGMVALLLAFVSGAQLGQQRAERMTAREQEQARQRLAEERQRGQARLADFEQQQRQLRQEHAAQLQRLEQGLEHYRQNQRRRVALPTAWRLQHDAAARLPTAATASAPASATAGPTDDLAALDTVSRNYALCQQWRDTVIGWQQWYRLVEDAPAMGTH